MYLCFIYNYKETDKKTVYSYQRDNIVKLKIIYSQGCHVLNIFKTGKIMIVF